MILEALNAVLDLAGTNSSITLTEALHVKEAHISHIFMIITFAELELH
jgi:hypothetical protein